MNDNKDNLPIKVDQKELEKLLIQRNPKFFKDISPQKKEELLRGFSEAVKIEITQFSQSFSGPIPHPDILLKYKDVDPLLPSRIVTMTEETLKHGRERDNKIIDKTFEVKKRGQTFALTISLVVTLGGLSAILLNHDLYGTIFGGFGLVSLVAQFLGNWKEKRNTPN